MREYNKDKLLNLIRKSVGTRNIKSFSEAAGLSADYMYRLLKGRFSDSPRKSTLKKISDASKGIVTYSELLLAAGYTPEKASFNSESSLKATILLSLADSNLRWEIDRSSSQENSLLSISTYDTPYKKWQFINIDQHPSENMDSIQLRLGMYSYALQNKSIGNLPPMKDLPLNVAIALMPFLFAKISSSMKISFVTGNVEEFTKCKGAFLPNLNMNISVILLDSINPHMISETIISSSDKILPESLYSFV